MFCPFQEGLSRSCCREFNLCCCLYRAILNASGSDSSVAASFSAAACCRLRLNMVVTHRTMVWLNDAVSELSRSVLRAKNRDLSQLSSYRLSNRLPPSEDLSVVKSTGAELCRRDPNLLTLYANCVPTVHITFLMVCDNCNSHQFYMPNSELEGRRIYSLPSVLCISWNLRFTEADPWEL